VGSEGMHFFHSSADRRIGVVEETRDNAWALRKSNWRMLGHLTGEADVMRTWLKGDKVKVRIQ
jgi:hypothetical protein